MNNIPHGDSPYSNKIKYVVLIMERRTDGYNKDKMTLNLYLET